MLLAFVHLVAIIHQIFLQERSEASVVVAALAIALEGPLQKEGRVLKRVLVHRLEHRAHALIELVVLEVGGNLIELLVYLLRIDLEL